MSMTIAEQATAGVFGVLEEPLNLLFVDDDPILREFALEHLGRDRWHVSLAADGEEALAAIGRDFPDLVLLDLQMPKRDGFAVLQALRADEATRRVPVIVITSQHDVASIDRAFAEGAASFAMKPINWPLLIYQIRYVYRARRIEASLLEHIGEVERKKAELEATSAELASALRRAEVASEAKSQFLAAASHELRTPLNAIIGFSEIIGAEALGPVGNARYLEYAKDILDSGKHLLSLVNDVLEFSRGSDGETVLQEEDFTPAEIIDEALRTVAEHARAANIYLSTEVAGCGAVRLWGDRRRVRQVLINLLDNSIKFTPAGGRVTVDARRVEDGLAIAISDTGFGIAAQDIPKALDPFGQVDSNLARKYDGVGLGLPLARRFMEWHGGFLDIESTVNTGTTVTVTFPAIRVVEHPARLTG